MQLQEKEGVQDDEYLKHIVINFILAGRDTTSNALSWLFFCLGNHPAVEERLRSEMERVLGDRELDYEAVRGFDYLQAVLTETLRLYPSVPSDPKYVVKDDVLPTGHKVYAGQQIAYNPFSMGRLPSIWGEVTTRRSASSIPHCH
jgi:cytochrome P450